MNKKLLIMTGVLLGSALVLALSDKLINRPDSRLGMPIVEMSALMGMDSIRLSQKDRALVLLKDKDSVWRLGSDAGFPADAAKISRSVDILTRTHVQMLVSSSKALASEFGMSEAAEMTLRKGSVDLARIKLGGNRDRGGQYISFVNDPKVYLISESLDGNPEESGWELKRLLNIPASQVRRLEFKPVASSKRKPVILVREKPEDPIKVEKISAGAKEASTIRSHESILSDVSFVTRLAVDGPSSSEAKKALAKPTSVSVALFDGRVFDVQVGSSDSAPQKYFMFITAKKGEKTAQSDIQEIDWINSAMGAYVFEVSSMVAERFQKGYDDMIERKGSKS